MATYREHLLQLQRFLKYEFTDTSQLEKALTAPGAEGDKDGNLEEKDPYEGNRKLAQIGNPLHQLEI
jgi:hypothetical protein